MDERKTALDLLQMGYANKKKPSVWLPPSQFHARVQKGFGDNNPSHVLAQPQLRRLPLLRAS